MEKDKKKIIAGAACLGGAAALIIHMFRKGVTPPPPPPPPGDVGLLQGHILDSTTSERLAEGSVSITIDSEQSIHNDLDSSGGYRTPYLAFGTHHFSVMANNYETGEFDIEITETFAELDLLLDPLPPAPTDWSEGVEVREIHVESPIYVGETLTIGVSIVYPHPLPLPADIYGSILVDGIELSGQWTIDIRNPRLYFEHTPTSPGTYTIRAQDKSATFEVLALVTATYYNPFGGTRFPICTELTVPTADGDVVFSRGENQFDIINPSQAVIDALPQAYPSQWSPAEATVRQWEKYISSQWRVSIMPTDYDCPEYWDSKAELASVIAKREMQVWIPWDWLNQFGDRIKLTAGWRDWVVAPNFYSICGGGYCSRYIDCPVCGERVFYETGIQGSATDREKGARVLLEHIETEHPNHPLTEPAF